MCVDPVGEGSLNQEEACRSGPSDYSLQKVGCTQG